MKRTFNYLFYLVATLSVIVIRTVILFFVIDPKSGFPKGQYEISFIMMICVIVPAMCFIYLFPRFSRDTVYHKKKPGGIWSAASAVFLAVIMLYETFFAKTEYASPSWQTSAGIVFAIAGSLVLICIAAADLLRFQIPPIITLIPLLYWLMRLIIVFTAYTTLATIFDNTLEIACLCLIVIFFLQYAKIYCGQLGKQTEKRTFAICLLASSLCFSNAIPRMILEFSGNAALLHKTDMPPIATLAAGIFILIFCVRCYPIKPRRTAKSAN